MVMIMAACPVHTQHMDLRQSASVGGPVKRGTGQSLGANAGARAGDRRSVQLMSDFSPSAAQVS